MSWQTADHDAVTDRVSSLALATLVSILYPASLYIWPDALTSDRHETRTIKRNFISVFAALALSIKALSVFKEWTDPDYRQHGSLLDYFHSKSYPTNASLVAECVVRPLAYALVLFIGPIYAEIRQLDHCDTGSGSRRLLSLVRTMVISLREPNWWMSVRNLLVAPVTEEAIFRGIVLAILLPFWSKTTAILLSSFLFGLMHLHHCLRSVLVTRRVCHRELVGSLVQCTYTSLFGLYAALVYVTAGNLISPILLHAFCNLNGLPNFSLICSNKHYFLLTTIGFLVWLHHLSNLFLQL